MVNFDTQRLCALCADFCPLDKEATERLSLYGNLLIEWNEKMNLTAITDPEGILIKHFYDSLLFFKAVNPQKNAKIIDVGTGAGFPGMVIKIARPDINLCLLDSLQKRLVFLEEVLKETALTADVIHARAEEGARKKELREGFDIACARAVAALPVLSEYCLPFVKRGGIFAALKGAAAREETAAAQNAVKLLGGKILKTDELSLPDGDRRAIITVKKISQTPTKYPRISAKIAKQPL